MLEKSAKVAAAARAKGIQVIHAPIMFKEDASDNPNKCLGILAGCAKDRLFTEGTWNADFHESMKPVKGDVVVKGKRGLDGFPGTDLESTLVKKKIEARRPRLRYRRDLSLTARIPRRRSCSAASSPIAAWSQRCARPTRRVRESHNAIVVMHIRAGFNTITLTDCCATTSAEGQIGATEGTFGMFSSPMTGEEFLKKINA